MPASSIFYRYIIYVIFYDKHCGFIILKLIQILYEIALNRSHSIRVELSLQSQLLLTKFGAYL